MRFLLKLEEKRFLAFAAVNGGNELYPQPVVKKKTDDRCCSL